MIKLSESTPFAEGGNRKCFVHPNNPERCLKVIHAGLLDEIIKKKPWYKKLRSKNSFNDNLREKEAYGQKALNSNNPNIWKHLARWYGMIDTDIGMASETELIKNGNEIAETLESYLFTNGLTEEIKVSINQFQEWLKKNLILTKNLLPHNLVIKRSENVLSIVIVDGLGSQAFIPLPNYSTFFAKKYVKRRIKLMNSRITWDLSGRKGSWK
tara:strand:- start:3599 stop:4234 length:636 start_codon:yes stop_codon:yes gene_type:complete